MAHLTGKPLWIPQEELENVAGESDVWNTILSLQPHPREAEEGGWINGWTLNAVFEMNWKSMFKYLEGPWEYIKPYLMEI